jgi:SpoVK/Ycf46/Vps4 family AAA+-type ATPase
VYIDEVSSIGSARSFNSSGAEKERSSATDQLLAEVNGFNGKEYVLLICSTNYSSALDKAFLDRFDVNLYIPLPDKAAKAKIVETKIKKIPYAKDLSADKIAQAIEDVLPQASGRNIDDIMKLSKDEAYYGSRKFSPELVAEVVRNFAYGKKTAQEYGLK